jgi:hypothetical protein
MVLITTRIKNVQLSSLQNIHIILQPGRLMIYLNRIFNCRSIQYQHTRPFPFASTGKLSVSNT